MGDKPLANPPSSDPTPEEESKFQKWFHKYLTEHETEHPSPPTSIPQSSGGQPQSGQGIEAAIEAVLNRRERSSQRDSRIKKLETDNTDLRREFNELKEAVKKPVKSVFSLFS